MFKKLLSTRLNNSKIDVALFILRFISGGLMILHGYQKMIGYDKMSGEFMSFLGLSPQISLGLVIGAEFCCAIFLAAGLFTRLALIPLIITMVMAAFKAHHGDIFGDGQTSFLYLTCYITLFISGPGKYSMDKLVFGKLN
jgi:putative oxidoreductase